MRVVARVLVLLLAVPALAPAVQGDPIVVPPEPARVVGGHTAFALVELAAPGAASPSVWTPGAPTALPPAPNPPSGNGGLRWLNDQDVVPPAHGFGMTLGGLTVLVREVEASGDARHPCTGAVMLADAGGGDPSFLYAFPHAYLHSYRVLDPAGRAWVTDVWDDPVGGRFLVTALHGNDATMGAPDDGASGCAPLADEAWSSVPGEKLRYNAFLVAGFADLGVAGPAAAHPSGASTLDGNSHPRWPYAAVLGPRADAGAHPTREVSVYYGAAPVPAWRTFVIDQAPSPRG